VRVRAQDEDGNRSDWTRFSFMCADSTTAGLNEGGEGSGEENGDASIPVQALSIRALPSLVRSGATTKVNWSASGVRSCTVSAPNGDAWTGPTSAVGGETSKPITGETKYTLSCEDRTGATLTKTATVNIIPTWQEQ
jgi:hypothetical protein